jgi:hypothetical protein
MPETSTSKRLLSQFLEMAESHNQDVKPLKVLKTNTFSVGSANVLVRTASDNNRRFFFGLNYLNAEEIINLDNSYIAFICGNINNTILLPSAKLIDLLPSISHDRNGEYKINFTRDFQIVLNGRGNRFDCSNYINGWELLAVAETKTSVSANPLESIHSLIQGRLLEIGNLRGYSTFCPDKSKTFNNKRLDSISKLSECPKLQFTDHESLRQIDVIWFRKTNGDYYPEYAFEVEISTGVWSGFGRLATLREFNTKLLIVTHDQKKFNQVRSSFPDLRERCQPVQPEKIGLLYSTERNLIRLRSEFNI